VEYCTSQNTAEEGEELGGRSAAVQFLVLDSPYTSVKQMVVDGSKAIKCFGLAVPELMVRLACRVVRGKVAARLGCDPFDLKPLRLVEEVGRGEDAGALLPPCRIFSAVGDDYIPATQGREMQRAWQEAGAECALEEFQGRHFGERDVGLLLGVVDDIRTALDFNKEEYEAATLRLGLGLGLGGAGAGGSSLPLLRSGVGSGKVPWAGVW
jgi:hypothetical protein